MFSKSMIIILIIVCLVLAGCNFLKGVMPDGDNSGEETINSPNLGGLADFVEQEVLVKIKPGADIEKIILQIGGTIVETLPQISVIRIKLAPRMTVAEAIKVLEEFEELEYAEPNGICYMDVVIPVTPNDSDYDSQWAPQLTGAESAWGVTTGLNSIIIAVTDTGVDGTHPDFGGKVIAGWDAYNNVSISAGADSAVDPHGTHCAGIAAAVGNNRKGMAGVAWGSKIMPIKISDDGPNYSASDLDMAEAFIWAVDNGADIISCSFSGKGYSQTMKDAVDYAVIDRGCVMVTSMGNSYINETNYPSGYQSIIAVGATDAYDKIADFSTTGSHMSVCAPGVEIYSTLPDGGYDYWDGTSMACPFVAGAAALILSQNPGMSPEGVKAQLEETAVDLGSPGFDSTYGHGRVNLAAAVGVPVANEYGIVDVLVTDLDENPLSGASVILWQGGTVISTTNSNENGRAIFNYIQVGEYGISVSLPCFISSQAADNTVTVVANKKISKTIAFPSVIEIKPAITGIDAFTATITLTTDSETTSNFINLDVFQGKMIQLQEKGILKTSNKFNRIAERLTRNSTTTNYQYLIEVAWDSYSDATGYSVFKRVNGTDYVKIFSGPNDDQYYDDWDVPGNTYDYYVVAHGCGWKTEPSEIVTIDTFLPSCSLISPANKSIVTDSTPIFTWNPVGALSFPYGPIYYGESDLCVYDSTDEKTVWLSEFDNMTTAAATYNDDGLAFPLISGHTYRWESWGYGYDENWNLIAVSGSESWEFTYKP